MKNNYSVPHFIRRKLYEIFELLLPYYALCDRGLIADRVRENVATMKNNCDYGERKGCVYSLWELGRAGR